MSAKRAEQLGQPAQIVVMVEIEHGPGTARVHKPESLGATLPMPKRPIKPQALSDSLRPSPGLNWCKWPAVTKSEPILAWSGRLSMGLGSRFAAHAFAHAAMHISACM